MAFTVEYTISGGTPNYTVTLSGNTNYVNNHTADGTYNFTGVEEGTYTLISVDSKGCTLESPVILVASTTTPSPGSCQLTSFNVSTTTSSGSDGTITFTNVQTAVGNLTYTISGASGQQISANPLFTGLAPGQYDVQVEDDITGGCILTGVTRVFSTPVIEDYSISISNIADQGGSGKNGLSEPTSFYNGTLIQLNVNGNGETGGFTPGIEYKFGITTTPIDGRVYVVFRGNSYENGDLININLATSGERGTMATENTSQLFDGGDSIGSGNNGLRLYNTISPGLSYATIDINLYLDGSYVETKSIIVNNQNP